jgi:5'-3' exonuclease
MGLTGLNDIIKKYAPNAMQIKKPSELPTGLWGLDVSCMIYASKYRADSKGKGSHIRLFLDTICAWKKAGHNLVMVFDGHNMVDEKTETLEKRKKIRAEQLKSSGPIINITDQDFNDLIELFKLTATPYLFANREADHLLAWLCKKGLLIGVISEDGDMLAHGCPLLVKGLNDYKLRKEGQVKVIDRQQLLTDAGLDDSQFVNFCVLSGCDYFKVPGVGAVTALREVTKCTDIVSILHGLSKQSRHSSWLENLPDFVDRAKKAVILFQDHSLEDKDLEELRKKIDIGDISDNLNELKKWLISETNYTINTIEKKLLFLQRKPVSLSPPNS